jgi:hypothetical protein
LIGDEGKQRMPPKGVQFQADRIGTLVTNIAGVIVAAIAIPLVGYITQKLTTIPEMALAGGGTAVVGLAVAFYRQKRIGLEWIELDDRQLVVGINKTTHRIRWDEMTKVVQNYDPEEEWYIYTNAQNPSLRFGPSSLAHKDLKVMREFIKSKVGYTTERDPDYVARNYKK